MKKMFYYVDEKYIQYLKEVEIKERGFTTVPNVEYTNHKKFVYGVIMEVNNIDYFVPSSSYKKAQQDNLLIKIEDHKKYIVRGSMRFNYMIPVPKKCLIPVDFNGEDFDEREKIMLRKEYKSCLHMLSKAQKKAVKTYYRVNQGADENLIKNSCMFNVLERAYISYLDKMEKQ